ncbi:hypothetical protein EIN_328210, partial [Entamoeba invadens IP1]
MIVLPAPYMLIPGVLSLPYLVEFLVLSVCIILTTAPIVRLFSLFTIPYSIAHFIVAMVFYFVDFSDHWAYSLLGLSFGKSSQAFFITHQIFVGLIAVFSVFAILTNAKHFEYFHTTLVTTFVSTLFFVSSFLINTSQGGIIPILFFLTSQVLFITPRKLFIYINGSSVFLMFIYLLVLSLWNLFASVADRFGFFDGSDNETLEKAMGFIGFAEVAYPSWIFFSMNYGAYLVFPLICVFTHVTLIGHKEKKTSVAQIATELQTQTENDKDVIDNTVFDKSMSTKLLLIQIAQMTLRTAITLLKVGIQILVKSGLIISLAVMFWVGLTDVSIFGFSFMLISLIFIFVPLSYARRAWPIVIVFTSLIILLQMVIQLSYINVSKIPQYVGLFKFNDNELGNKTIDFDDTHLEELYPKIILLVVANLQFYANLLGSKVSDATYGVKVFYYCASRLIDFWGIFICCVVIATAAFFEDVNLELILYVGALALLVLIQTHFSCYKVIIRTMLPVYSIVFFVILLVRYVVQLTETDEERGDLSEITEWHQVFTNMSMSELGFVKYTTVWQRFKGFLPNIAVIACCAIESRMLFTIPRYLQKVVHERSEKKKRYEKYQEEMNARLERSMANESEMEILAEGPTHDGTLLKQRPPLNFEERSGELKELSSSQILDNEKKTAPEQKISSQAELLRHVRKTEGYKTVPRPQMNRGEDSIQSMRRSELVVPQRELSDTQGPVGMSIDGTTCPQRTPPNQMRLTKNMTSFKMAMKQTMHESFAPNTVSFEGETGDASVYKFIEAPRLVKSSGYFVMRFLAIYIPHISVICAIVIAAYPSIKTKFSEDNKNEVVQTWDILHFLVFLTTMLCLISKRGFNIACAPLLWVCTFCMLVTIIPNFRSINLLIDQSGMFKNVEYKKWAYNLIGIKSC